MSEASKKEFKKWWADEVKTGKTIAPFEIWQAAQNNRTLVIQEMLSDALQSDLEHGVKWLNEKAAREFHEQYPDLTLALTRISGM